MMRANNITSKVILSLVLSLVVAAVSAMAADAVVEGGGKGMCDAENADGSCDDVAEASAPEVVAAGIGAGSTGIALQCEDKDPRCGDWASKGECQKNPVYMLADCQLSCKTCPNPISPEEFVLMSTVAKYGEPQEVKGDKAPDTLEVIRRTVLYMENDIHGPNPTHNLSEEVLAGCINRDKRCAFWAVIGECEKNPSYMKMKCAPSCQTCELIDIDNRCPPLGDNVRPGLLPGELNAMFERIVRTAPGNQTDPNFVIDEGMTNYTVTVHSRPKLLDADEEPIISVERDLEQPPWVITFENFISEEECKQLIDLGYKSEYKRSEDVGVALPDGTFNSKQSDTRTSENAWCSHHNGCRNDTLVLTIHDRIAKVTGIPPENSEDLQVLKYEPGQFYRVHHDYIDHQRDRRCGPRMLTFFLYLSDVEDGGATNFPDLNIAVKPKLGRALLWPSVLDGNPKKKEPRTRHEAQDVIKGVKFGANAWLHLYDYMDAQKMGCN